MLLSQETIQMQVWFWSIIAIIIIVLITGALIYIMFKMDPSAGKVAADNAQSGKMYNSSMATELARRGFDVTQVIPEIEEELNHPVYAQVHSGPFASKANFYITKNWIIGYRISMQKMAVRKCDIVRVREDKIPIFRGPDYCVLNILDRNGTEYNFYMLNAEYRKAAFLYIANRILGDERVD
ncbi:MAG: hypothetical protein E7292_00960 [Lachnospiraceae bacterium]|nr:hypothetical protein [Lachnospiraceae bacterium]